MKCPSPATFKSKIAKIALGSAVLLFFSNVAWAAPTDSPNSPPVKTTSCASLSGSEPSLAAEESNKNLRESAMRIPSTVYPGKSYPLGAIWDGSGVNFAVYSDNASLVQLCLFDDYGREASRINLKWKDSGVWHCYLPQAKPGLKYGFRAHGAYNPSQGHYFNPDKLLLDPYAKSVTGSFQLNDALYSYVKDSSRGVSKPDDRDGRDSAPYMPKCQVVDDSFDWGHDFPPNIPLSDSIIYEVHVKGFSKNNPKVPYDLRGSYAGFGSPASIEYLQKLGITAVELLPVHLTMSEGRLSNFQLSNYWGYNSIGFFAPDPRFASSDNAVNEFKQMVKNLHEANIEVLLDVVYNHTAEQGCDGPTLCFRGLDNANYYRLNPQDFSSYLDYTGCGNSVDTRNMRTLQLITDSLRYWVEEMHVDGFRFDLATTLARVGSDNSYQPNANFLSILAQDPVLCRVKLIAEPWDCGPGGYQLGNFPQGWSEWNGDWRDTARRFWRGDHGLLGKMAGLLSGSSDHYWQRSPQASINFVTCHDGYTLNDIVSYEVKHNEANGEHNRDGSNDNYSWNCGQEGPTKSTPIKQLRGQQVRNMLMSVMFSQGVPMLLGGDEIGRTQKGNNNAYCQDNDISYYNWNLTQEQKDLLAFTQKIIHIRREHPVFCRKTFLHGELKQENLKDVIWYNQVGTEMSDEDWNSPGVSCLGMYIAGDCLEGTSREGWPISDDSFLFIINSDSHSTTFNLPQRHNWAEWHVMVASSNKVAQDSRVQGSIAVEPHSAVLLAEQPRRP